MFKKMIAAVWRAIPKGLRFWSVRAAQSKFTVTAGAVVMDEGGRVLLVRHVFRSGSGWGIPGGFIAKREQPEAAVRRELREEIGLEVDQLELALVRTVRIADQVEIIYRCRAASKAAPRSLEVQSVEWFALDSLPNDLSAGQRKLIEQALDMMTSR